MRSSTESEKNIRVSLLKLDSELKPDLDFVAAEAGDTELSETSAREHALVKEKLGKKLYADMLLVLTNQHFTFEHAEGLWLRILKHKKKMGEVLGRNPGVAVAALDFLTNIMDRDENLSLISEEQMIQVTEVAIKDGLTGLYDHATFQMKLSEELARFHRTGEIVSLIMGDVDNFKNFNDTHGHRSGDRVLKKIASILLQEIRQIDIGARYGGEEFVVLSVSTQVRDAFHLAERIRKRVAEEWETSENVSISFGVADCRQTNGRHDGLIEAADKALYEAKNRGKNQTVVFDRHI